MEPPTKAEIELLKDIRRRITDLVLSEEYLLDKNLVRFLRARNGNLDAAEQMIRNNRRWYVTEDIKGLLANYESPKGWEDHFSYTLVGFDRYKNPFFVADFGKWDMAKEMAAGNKDEFFKYCGHHMEKAWTFLQRISKSDDHMKQLVGIIDLNGFTFRQYMSIDVVEIVIRHLKNFEANYPETIKAAVVVNGSDKEKWREAIERIAEPDQYPEYYGGKLPNGKKIYISRDGSTSLSENQNEYKKESSIDY